MLGRGHGTSVDVHVGINLDGGHLETGSLEKETGRGGYPMPSWTRFARGLVPGAR